MLLFPPVLTICKLVLHSAVAAVSGELLFAGHGGPPPALCPPAAGALHPPPKPSQPFDLRSTVEIRTYPFGVKVVKEPLEFLGIKPAVLYAFGKYVLLF